MEQVDCIVVGAGVVGLAVARSLGLSGREVICLEAESEIGTGSSSRNSEVIHAGIYYAAGSLKARLCVQGKGQLYRYCESRNIEHERCGKLIVATNVAETAQLAVIAQKAAANGVNDLLPLTRTEARALELQLECVAALLSPSTGIVDSHALMLALQADLEAAGGLVALNSTVQQVTCRPNGLVVTMQDGTELQTQVFVNAAGLHAVDLARRIDGLAAQYVPEAFFAKGNYFTLAGRAPFRHLIYPVPQAAGLGGQAKFGPDVQWVDSPNDLTVDASRGDAFYAEVRRYWPDLKDDSLQPGYAGIRPKINSPSEPASDFMIQGPADHGIAGLVNLFGIESPGLTSSLAIGDYVAALIK